MANNESLLAHDNEHEPRQHEALERQDQLSKEREKNAERVNEHQEKSVDNARHEIEKITAEREPRKHESVAEHAAERKIDSKTARKKAYDSIMSQARTEMSAPERAFSKVIHNPVIEKVSELAGSTVARPNAILSGAVFAFILTLAIYLVAKQSGYPLTGTETIAAFVIGWVLGNIYDFAKTMARGGR